MTPSTPAAPAQMPFSQREMLALRRLRRTYQQDRDLLSDAERARLRFQRWLYATGRLTA